ncbi:type IV pilus modification protein PilV [Motiliproteus sediminis]|uniref:type IV pilus modification protein PilV n=1 Tax=Motiliproteus sediminis TaxID=1468178 RepID=UPI001AEF5CAF|nr:type IV pilus modification protein PilV [Motiliproteus sediminis]
MPLIACYSRLSRSSQRGVSMMEVLIALVLLTTALLGATALQLTGLQNNRSAYYRSQASLLAYDFADRIRVNAGYALADSTRYEVDTASPAVPSATSCAPTLNGCSDSQIRDIDLREWYENFFDVTGVGHDGSDYRPLLPSGTAEVTATGPDYTITISWQEVDWNVGANSNRSDTTKQFILDFNVTD